MDGVVVNFLAPKHEAQKSISPFVSVLKACSLLLYLLLRMHPYIGDQESYENGCG